MDLPIIDQISIAPKAFYRVAPLALALVACSPATTVEEAPATQKAEITSDRHPISGLELIDVTVVSGDQRTAFVTELANTPQAQTRGLMFRTEIADDEAMLFPSDVPQTRSFWMRNTPISLDIVFVGTDNRITNIAERTEPYSLESLPSEGLAIAVLEIRGGLSEELGIGPGDLVEYSLDDIASENEPENLSE